MRLCGIDARIHPRTLLHHLRKKTKLIHRARQLAFKPPLRQRGFPVRPRHQFAGDGFDSGGDVAKKMRLLLAGQLSVSRKRLGCQTGRQGQVFG